MTTTNALGHQTSATWDVDGNETSSTDADGRTTMFQFDPDDRLVKRTRPDGTSTSIKYNADGTIAGTTNGVPCRVLRIRRPGAGGERDRS